MMYVFLFPQQILKFLNIIFFFFFQDALARKARQAAKQEEKKESSPFRPTLTSKQKGNQSRGNVFNRLYEDAKLRNERRKSQEAQ